jgi:hypothetical protein
VVVPAAQGAKYRPAKLTESDGTEAEDADDIEAADTDDGEDEGNGKKSKIEFVEDIVPEAGSPGKFFLRVGLGRKASGSYYTPDSFVRFLVQETLRPQVEECSPVNDPQPGEILKLKVLDPAMGSGHFLVGACRFLGERLYEACRLCADKGLWDRIPAEVTPYLPGRVQEGEAEVGVSADRARAICKRLVAVHCLYGVDKNELAVELAKVCLWLESQADGMPLTFLDHRLVHGDSLTGPFWNHLVTYPIGGGPVEGLFAQGVQEKFSKRLASVLTKVKWLEQNVGATPDEIAEKQKLKAEIDTELFPFRVLALTWSGAVMLGEEKADNQGYANLVKHIAEKGELPESLEPRVLAMLRCGAGMEDLPATRREWYQMLTSSHGGATSGPALAYDLAFPEVFYPTGVFYDPQGFHAVLGNPPWEGLDTSNKEFYANFDFSIMEASTDSAIQAILERLRSIDTVEKQREEYDQFIEAYKRTSRRYFSYVNQAADQASAATPDMFQCFAERAYQLVRPEEYIGNVLPSSFHSNEGAAGLRRLYLEKATLRHCYSFENRKGIFDIHRSFKFAVVVAQRSTGGTESFPCAFYLLDDNWLFEDDKDDRLLRYTPKFLKATTGDLMNFLELRSTRTVPIAETMYGAKEKSFGVLREDWRIAPTEELHTSKQRFRTKPISDVAPQLAKCDPRCPDVLNSLVRQGVFPVCKGEHFHQYDSFWGDFPEVVTTTRDMAGKEARLRAAQFYRLVFRQQASSTNERTVISHLCSPGLLFFHSALPERDPYKRPSWEPLAVVALCNSFPFDWLVRQLVSANVTFNFLDTVPVPSLKRMAGLLSHNSLRLTSQHTGYEPLWLEQLGDTWREPKPPFAWPVLATDDERWEVRAAIDAVVADAYGLNRDQYAHVLSTFSHKSYPQAPALCLAKFDELKQIGLDAFTKKYDPYWDIPLNESLPKPVIELPITKAEEGLFPDDSPGKAAKPARPRKKRG